MFCLLIFSMLNQPRLIVVNPVEPSEEPRLVKPLHSVQIISGKCPSKSAELSDESKESSINSLDRVNWCTLRIKNPEIQT